MPGQVIFSNVTMPEPMFSNKADREAHRKRGDIHSSNYEWRGERDGFPAERRTKRPLAGATDCHVYGRSGACSPGIIAAAGSCSGREVNEIRQRLLMALPSGHKINLERQERVDSGRPAAAPTWRQVSDADHSSVPGRKHFPQFLHDHFLSFTSWRATSGATTSTNSKCAFVAFVCFVNFESLAHQRIFA